MRICLSTATRVLRLKQFGNELLELLAVHGGAYTQHVLLDSEK
jgi:hypothetical protein